MKNASIFDAKKRRKKNWVIKYLEKIKINKLRKLVHESIGETTLRK